MPNELNFFYQKDGKGKACKILAETCLHFFIRCSCARLSSRCFRVWFSMFNIRFCLSTNSSSAETSIPSAYKSNSWFNVRKRALYLIYALSYQDYLDLSALACKAWTFLSNSAMYWSFRTRDRWANCLSQWKDEFRI